MWLAQTNQNVQKDNVESMKRILFPLVIFLAACSGKEYSAMQTIDLADIPVQKVKFEVLPLDTSKVIYPTGILVWNDHLILATPKEDNLFSFWNRNTLAYQFSTTIKGQGPDDISSLDPSYMKASSNSIFVLDDNTEVEMTLEENRLKCIKRTPIIIGDAVNGFSTFKVDEKSYITLGASYKIDSEHYKYDGENVVKFGTFPALVSEGSVGEDMVVQYNHKISVGMPGKKIFFNFYDMLNLIRKYDVDGNLLGEIKVLGAFQKENSFGMFLNRQDKPCTPYWYYASVTEKYMCVLFYQGQTMKEIVEMYKETVLPEMELQIWDWTGNLKARYSFDRPFSNFTVAEDGTMYAFNRYEGDAIYRFKIFD